jgi:hypothetical protein
MSKGPPVRLRDDPAIARALRDDLARARGHAGSRYDVAAGLAKFEETLRIGHAVADPQPSGPGAGAGAGGKTLLGAALKGALLGVAVIGGAAVLPDRSPPPASAPRLASVVVEATAVGETRSAATFPAIADTPPSPRPLETAKPLPVEAPVRGASRVATPAPAATELPPEPTLPAAAPTPAAPATPAIDGDPLAAEVAHLARLRAIQDGDPAAALALSAEGSQRFPRGLFAQEREAIAVGALVRLGRVAEARTRARAFLAAYPRSSFAERIEKLTGIGGTP